MSAQRSMLSARSFTNAAAWRSSMRTWMRFGQIRTMDASRTQRTFSSALRRDLSGNKKTLRPISGSKILRTCAREAYFHSLDFEIGTFQSVIGRTGQDEARIADDELLEALRSVNAGGEKQAGADDDQAVAKDHTDSRARGASYPSPAAPSRPPPAVFRARARPPARRYPRPA